MNNDILNLLQYAQQADSDPWDNTIYSQAADEITNLRNLGDQLAKAVRTGRVDDALDAWDNYRSKEADGIVADLINRATTWLDSSDDYRLDMAAANKIQQLCDQLKQCKAERDTYSRLYDEVRVNMDEIDLLRAQIAFMQPRVDND